MSLIRIFTTLFIMLLPLMAAPAGHAQTSNDPQIRGFQTDDGIAGVLYTAKQLLVTHTSGRSWTVVPLPSMQGAISAARISGPTLTVLFTEPASAGLTLAETNDNGVSWHSATGHPDPDVMLDADVTNARLTPAGSGAWTLVFRAQTSSNFEGEIWLRSDDNGSSWQFVDRRVDLRHEGESTDGQWRIVRTGDCRTKISCEAIDTLVDGAADITPPEIRDAQRREQVLTRQSLGLLSSAPGGSTRISLNRGFDKCAVSSVSQMQTWWDTSPFFDSNIYISGRARACSQPLLNAAWVNAVSNMGWGLVPTIVGYQSPCISSSTYTGARFSLDAATAEQQGRGEADIAVNDAMSLGLTAGSVLYYDMERYDETASTAGCRTASTAFLKGWSERVRDLGYKAGTYGSPRNAMDDWQNMPAASRMDAVWLANWDNNPSVWSFASFPTFPQTAWPDHQRLKQWIGARNETWGGVTFNIDNNISDGPVAGIAVRRNKRADFDGDGRADVGVYRFLGGLWYITNSANSSFFGLAFGQAGDIAVPGDYDGDGKTDFAVFRPPDGIWYMLGKGNTYSARAWGQNGDIPAPGDYNGDGKTDLAVFRQGTGVWYIANSDSRGTYTAVQWGSSGDLPVVGDYDGDGKADIAVFRRSNGVWYILRSSDGGYTIMQFGFGSDKPVEADYDGDGKTDIAVFRPSTGVWYMLLSSTGAVTATAWGQSDDLPAPGDYDGDGKDDLAVFRPSNSIWYLLQSQAGFTTAYFGLANDRPVANLYIPQ